MKPPRETWGVFSGGGFAGLAVDCGVCPGYHYDELNHILEIVDPDTGEVLPYGREGEVVLTNIARDCMPLLRYRTGDIAVLERSICGSHLDMLGHIRRRKEGAYRQGDRELYPALFDEVIFAQPDILDYRIFAQGDQLYFDLEVLEPEAFSPRDTAMRLAALEPLQGLRNPILRALPCGALPPFRFEKKGFCRLKRGEGGRMEEILHRTESRCPICLRKVPARYIRENKKVYLCKECPEHGPFKVLFWRDADLYQTWMAQGIHAPARNLGRPESRGCPYDCGLCDEHHSGTCTAILEITYRCNMQCSVCFADANAERFEPSVEQIRTMYQAALDSNRFCSVQLSGGEPTVREDLPEIVRLGKELGTVHLQVNTNGIRIAQDFDYVTRLKEAGLDLIYLQFDGVDDEIYQAVRGRDLLEIKKRAIENCGRAGLGVLLVPVVIPGVNFRRLGEIIRFARERIPVVRGVHFQPVSFFGRYPGDTPPEESRCGLDDLLHALEAQTGGELRMEHFVPRKQFDPHCDFSSTYYLDEEGTLVATSHFHQNDGDTEETDFVAKTNQYTKKRWKMQTPPVKEGSRLMRFAARTLTHSFCVSGMGFQDAWNIDLGRLKGCCVHIVTGRGELIPFCAFHLTSEAGERLYQNEEEST